MNWKLLLTFVVTVAAARSALGQDVEVDTRSLGSAYARLVSFEAEPEIAAAAFSVDSDTEQADDLEIRTAKLPFYREFELDGAGRRWFIQATGSYLDMEETLRLDLAPGFTERLDASWEGFGVLVEGGLLFRLSDHLALAPSFGLGLTRIESDMDFSSQVLEDVLAPALDGVLYNWDTLASVVRASLALRYDRDFGDWRLKGSGHLSGSYVDSFDESRRFPGFSDEAGSFGLKLDASHPTPWEIRDDPVFVVGHVGYTGFIGSNRDELGFDGFGEVGLSLGLRTYTAGVLGILGSDVSGWALQFNYDY